MRMERFDPPIGWNEIVLVRLVRRWAALRQEGLPALPAMVQRAAEFGLPAEAAVALSSMLELTEACLGRPLRALSCCSPAIGADERAVLLMLALAPGPGQPQASRDLPHGLPSALGWAVASLRRLLGGTPLRLAESLGRCPFAPSELAPGSPGQAAFRPKSASLQFHDAVTHE